MCHDLLEICHFDMLTSFHYSDSYSAGMAMQQCISPVRTAEQAWSGHHAGISPTIKQHLQVWH